MEPIKWKGLTFQQVVGSLQKNTNTATNTRAFFKTPPLKIHRRMVGSCNNSESQSATIASVMEQPGGSIKTVNDGVKIVTMPNYPSDNGTNAASNALKRVKSAGMFRNRAYNVNSYQYLGNRERTFSQNQFNYFVSGNSSNLATIISRQNGSGAFNVKNPVVVYKPNNAKYGQQGGVSSSSRIERLKYETMQTVAKKYKETYGTNSQDYRVGATYSGTTQPGVSFGPKDRYNVPTPQITDVDFSKLHNHNRNVIL